MLDSRVDNYIQLFPVYQTLERDVVGRAEKYKSTCRRNDIRVDKEAVEDDLALQT